MSNQQDIFSELTADEMALAKEIGFHAAKAGNDTVWRVAEMLNPAEKGYAIIWAYAVLEAKARVELERAESRYPGLKAAREGLYQETAHELGLKLSVTLP